jgi:hypothetical protein
MKVRWSCVVVLALLSCTPACPDTLTTKDNLSVNGTLVGMSNGVLRFNVRFTSEPKEVRIRVEDVQSIEFNSVTFNSGPPPKILGFGPPSDQSASQKKTPVEDIIVLRGGSRQPCTLVGIDANRIHCDPNDAGYNRRAVLRIVFGSK